MLLLFFLSFLLIFVEYISCVYLFNLDVTFEPRDETLMKTFDI